MVTLEDINFAEAHANALEFQYNEAKNAAYQLKLQYIKENAKFQIGDKCKWINTTTKQIGEDIYKILAPHIGSTGQIQYLCSNNGLQLIAQEQNLIKIDEA